MMHNLTDDEVKAISSWTSPLKEYRYIKNILSRTYNGSLKYIYENMAKNLIELFNKYDDNTNNKVLYRGDILEDITFGKMTNDEIYNYYLRNNSIGNILIIEDSILSFTLSEEVAIKSYMESDKNKDEDTPSILYILDKRNSTFLNISQYSHFPDEEEVLCNKGIKFIVRKIEEHPNNHLVCYIDET